MGKLFGGLFLIGLIIFLIILGPWCFIWAINTLVVAGGVTAFHIPFDFWTWLAAVLLGGFLRGSTSKN